ncbi:LOW QUALITY PROTEIN: growth/differentiation factor 6-like [Lethenteron reissneri]|uniref:LOW QUALITY PROTEIN: growth/differentiation factor 6-like n=1 Tax=Lethenteron reissneri TaxID=7753 RepID=UPI002AB6CDCB|nr:LOW QUALITY PROTEIN: growth/differentiation factor 6-like [Lethenteron reissneri]
MDVLKAAAVLLCYVACLLEPDLVRVEAAALSSRHRLASSQAKGAAESASRSSPGARKVSVGTAHHHHHHHQHHHHSQQQQQQQQQQQRAGGTAGAGAHHDHEFRWSGHNVSVVPHEYMLSLYKTLSVASAGKDISANTITSFVDRGEDGSSVRRQRYSFDLTTLSRQDDLISSEFRVLRRAPEEPQRTSRMGNLVSLKLFLCPTTSRAREMLLDSRAVDLLDKKLPSWEVFDVKAAVERVYNDSSVTSLCLDLEVSSENSRIVTEGRYVGFSRKGRRPQEKALMVISSRAHKRGNLFNEIIDKGKASHGGGDGDSHEKIRGAVDVMGRTRKKDESEEVSLKSGHRHQLNKKIGGRADSDQAKGRAPKQSGGKAGSLPRGKASQKLRKGEIDPADSDPQYRRKRTPLANRPGGKGHNKKSKSRCSKKPLHVNFKELGWDDWIIAPLDYEAYHCEGVCDFPLRSHLEPTNHAIIQTLMNSMNPDSTPPSCCVPTKLSPISILYIDSGNNVVYKQYEDMVVESCGCR